MGFPQSTVDYILYGKALNTDVTTKMPKVIRIMAGRGIKMCDEWLNNPKAFCDWAVANGYKEEKADKHINILTIDRIDVNGDYMP